MALVAARPQRRHRGQPADDPQRLSLTEEEVGLYDLDGRPADVAHYLPQRRWETQLWSLFSQRDARAVLNDKWIFARYVSDLGLAVPRTYGVFHPHYGITHRLDPLRTADDLTSLAREVGPSGLVAKPVRGLRGKGLVMVEHIKWQGGTPRFVLAGGEALGAAELAERMTLRVRRSEGFIVQERCLAHPWLRGVLSPTTILRLVVLVPDSGEPVIQMGALFAVRTEHLTWSWKEGGMTFGIDVESGTLLRGRMLPQYSRDWHSHHPDTGRQVTGLTVPQWPEIRELVATAARATPGVRLAAWEVMPTPDGPRLIEGNLVFGIHTLQVHTSGFFVDGGIADQWREVAPQVPLVGVDVDAAQQASKPAPRLLARLRRNA